MEQKGIILDIGTGDGKFVYELAKKFPDRLFIGVDPSKESLKELSHKAAKVATKGGLPNIIYTLASIEQFPEELVNVANQVYINFPWGSLLQKVATGDFNAFLSIRSAMKEGSFLDIVFGYNLEIDAKEIKRLDLPELSIAYIRHTITQKLLTVGLKVVTIKALSVVDLKDYPSTWSKKLTQRDKRTYYHIHAIAM